MSVPSDAYNRITDYWSTMLWTAIAINGILKPTEGPGEVCDAKSVVTKTS